MEGNIEKRGYIEQFSVFNSNRISQNHIPNSNINKRGISK